MLHLPATLPGQVSDPPLEKLEGQVTLTPLYPGAAVSLTPLYTGSAVVLTPLYSGTVTLQ